MAVIDRTVQVAQVPQPGMGVPLDVNGKLPQAVQQTLPGYEFAYKEFTSPVSITATTEATANTVVTAPAIILDGATPVWVEFFSTDVEPDTTAAGRRVVIVLYDGSSSIGLFSVTFQQVAAAGLSAVVLAKRRLTPAAGVSKTYSVRAYVNAGTGSVSAGSAGTGNEMPGYIRVTRA